MSAPKGKGGSSAGGKKEDEVDKNRKIIRKFIKNYEQICSEASATADKDSAKNNNSVNNSKTNNGYIYIPYQPFVQKLAKLAKSEDGPPLDLSTIPISISSSNFSQNDLSLFLQALSTYPHYSSLSFIRTNLSDGGAIILSQFLKSNPFVKKLEVIDNKIGSLGSKQLGKAIQPSQTIQILKLDFNPLGDEGCSLLSLGLSSNTSLKELSLQYCEIGPIGILTFGEEVVCKNQSLTSIDLTGNPLGCEGISFIGKALPGANPNLKTLNLAATCLFREHGDVGFEALDKLAFGVEEQGMNKVRDELKAQEEEEAELLRIEQEKEERRQRGEYVPDTPAEEKRKTQPKKKTVEGMLGEMYLTELNLNLNPLDKRCAERILQMLQRRKTITHVKLHEQVDTDLFKSIMKQMLDNRENAIKRAKQLARMRKKGGRKKKK
jgi:hypothetical protein